MVLSKYNEIAQITEANNLELIESYGGTSVDSLYRSYDDGQSGNITVTVSSSSSWVSTSSFYGSDGCLTTVDKPGVYFVKATLRWTDTHPTVTSSNIAIYRTYDSNSTRTFIAIGEYSCDYTNATYIGEVSTTLALLSGAQLFVSFNGSTSSYTYTVSLFIFPIYYLY